IASEPTTAAIGTGAPARAEGDVPTLDVLPNCRSQAEQNTKTLNNCLDDEQHARDQIVKEWGQFAQQNKRDCTEMASNIAGTQSYVELLTCLQMAQDAKSLPKDIKQEGPISIMGGSR